MPFEPLDGRRSPAPQGTALLGVGDDTSSAGVDEFFARLRRGLTEPLPGASPMSSGRLMVDPNRGAAVPMALADMVKRVVVDAAGGWSDAYDMAAAGAEPHEYGPDAFKAAGVATAGGYARAGIGLGSAGGKLPNPQGLLTWAKQQPEFELLADKYFRQLQVQQAKEVGPAANTFMESANLGKDPGTLWRNTQDADKVVRLVKATKQSDLGDAAERMAAEALWMRTVGGPELGSAGGRLSAPRARGRASPASPDEVVGLVESMGLQIGAVKRVPNEAGETTYIKIIDPANPPIPHADRATQPGRAVIPTVRVPSASDPHYGRPARPHEIGQYFDAGTTPGRKTRQDVLTTENVSGEPFSQIENLAEALKWRFSRSPDGQWLVSPDKAPRGQRPAPVEAPPPLPHEGADLHPDQLRLLSGGVPVASLSEAPEKPPPHSKIPASRWWERMEPDSPSSQPRRESPPIRPSNPRRVRMAGVDDDEWSRFESVSEMMRALESGGEPIRVASGGGNVPLSVVERGLLGTMRAAEAAGVGGTALRIYNDVVQRGRTAPVTESDFSRTEIDVLRKVVLAKDAVEGKRSGSVDYADYIKYKGFSANSYGLENTLGRFRYTIDDQGVIQINDTYDFNKIAKSGLWEDDDNNELAKWLAAFVAPRNLAIHVGRKAVPEGKGIPVRLRIATPEGP